MSLFVSSNTRTVLKTVVFSLYLRFLFLEFLSRIGKRRQLPFVIFSESLKLLYLFFVLFLLIMYALRRTIGYTATEYHLQHSAFVTDGIVGLHIRRCSTSDHLSPAMGLCERVTHLGIYITSHPSTV